MQRTYLPFLALALSLAACGPGEMQMADGSMDGSNSDATGPMDGRSTEGGGGDAGAGVCDTTSVIDLAMRGMRTGMRTKYTGTTADARSGQQINPPANCVVEGFRAVRQVAHKYRMTTAGFLRASTVGMGTSMDHDTAVWIQRTCDTRGQAIGCNDDDSTSGTYASTVTSSTTLAAGTEVTIIVSTLAEAMTGDGAAYELNVEEVAPLARGMACDPLGEVDLCADGNTCVGHGEIGTCTTNGTVINSRCRPAAMNPRCDMGMTCSDFGDGVELCRRPAMLDMPCVYAESACPMDAECVGNDPGDPYAGICRRNGTRGGVCSATLACMMGVTCSSMDAENGTCRASASVGQACDPLELATECAGACLPAPMGMMGYTCQATGTAPGAPCRDGAMRCDTGMTCTTAMGDGVCLREVATGASCSPRFHQNRCATGQVCRATNFSEGTCSMPTMEPTGDNNAPRMAGAARMAPFAIQGSLSDGDDVDCYAVTVPGPRGNLYAEVSDGEGDCPLGAAAMGAPADLSDPFLVLYDSMGRIVDYEEDGPLTLCPVMDGTRSASPVRNLAGGTYTLCIEHSTQFGPPAGIPRYVLSVNVTPGM